MFSSVKKAIEAGLFLGAICAFAAPQPAHATETIIKLTLGEAGFDVHYNGSVLETLSDGNGATSGAQDTDLEFTGLLSFLPDVVTTISSFSLDNVSTSGSAVTLGNLVIQNTAGGSFSLYDSSNILLLSAALGNGAITGSNTQSTGSFFTTTFSTFTGGSLAALLDPNSAALSLALTSIFSGSSAGLQVTGSPGSLVLAPFNGDATVGIEGTAAVPEPATVGLLFTGLLCGAAIRRRKAI
jgi:hypothetical protein